jgi:hypothetical protein
MIFLADRVGRFHKTRTRTTERRVRFVARHAEEFELAAQAIWVSQMAFETLADE